MVRTKVWSHKVPGLCGLTIPSVHWHVCFVHNHWIDDCHRNSLGQGGRDCTDICSCPRGFCTCVGQPSVEKGQSVGSLLYTFIACAADGYVFGIGLWLVTVL